MKIPFEMFITGSYLGIESIISNSYNQLTHEMTNSTARKMILSLTDPEYKRHLKYGSAATSLLECSKLRLCLFGYKDPADKWDGLPAVSIVEIMSNEHFEPKSRLKKAQFLISLLKRRWGKRKSKYEVDCLELYLDDLYVEMTVAEKQVLSEYRSEDGRWRPKQNFLVTLITAILIMFGMLLLTVITGVLFLLVIVCWVLFVRYHMPFFIVSVVITPIIRSFKQLMRVLKKKKKLKKKNGKKKSKIVNKKKVV
ncbi:unnamed protein product [Ambrosiozyma monospora]|uniref:Unnamed protein product n=1 Tax=Ambrosiozyma monospora TaxID=43982 RepID=A0ACB5T4E6_AMBMO|nr:unnamed protein product [Ambrosiozyma monospora]